MNVLVLMDSFKGSLSSVECGKAVAEGIRRVYPESSVKILPVANGGEGTLEALMKKDIAFENLKGTSEQAFRLIRAAKKI